MNRDPASGADPLRNAEPGSRLAEPSDTSEVADEMVRRIARLYPICRSITGEGVRQTLRILSEELPLEIFEVPSGTQVFDWTVPREWNLREAYIASTDGERLVDSRDSNLHVLSYSAPMRRRVSREELHEHLFSIPEHPEWIPYRTSYYQENWGFCVAEKQRLQLQDDEYDVCIDSDLSDGSLTYAELLIPGAEEAEVLLSTHVCHPSLCNDNLSGVSLLVSLAKYLARFSLKYSYRLLFIPGTIGSITWLSRNADCAERIRHGLVVAGVGDRGHLHYKRSRRGSAEIDRAVENVFEHSGREFGVSDFIPYGYDERQYCSPGFDLPVGCLSRTPHGEYPEYHTSADDLTFVAADALGDSFAAFARTLSVLEGNETYLNRNPHCEPQLGRRDLYSQVGAQGELPDLQMALLWVLNLSDGRHPLLAIAERSGHSFGTVRRAADLLERAGLLSAVTAS